MQRGRNLLILLVLGLGLGAYVYFVEMKREPMSATADGSGGSQAEDPDSEPGGRHERSASPYMIDTFNGMRIVTW